ncbi:MAG: hypothetical protein ACAH59_14305 [Pseudobdellovibrionaceae bacterium]
MSQTARTLIVLSSLMILSACASNKIKERKDQRDKAAQASKFYCDFVNGEIYPDLDIALNLEMAKRCDPEKPFSLTQYKTPTENNGVIYCCSIAAPKGAAPTAVFDKKKPAEPAKKDDASKAETID